MARASGVQAGPEGAVAGFAGGMAAGAGSEAEVAP
jgi:hypothetical protein